MTSQTQTIQDTNQESFETSSKEQTQKYKKDTETAVMARVNQQKIKMRTQPDSNDYIETSEAMVKHFAADQDYPEPYVLVSGIKVCAEGRVQEMLDNETKPLSHRRG